MLATTLHLFVVAAEEFVPPDDWRTIIALPAAFLFFFFSVFLLLRSNLGTRRGYLVFGISTFGFLLVLTLYWTFGAPGTPMATGPQNLPGQPQDYYIAKWEPFAVDSTIADERYPIVKSFPEGFSELGNDLELRELVASSVEEIATFFSTERGGLPGPIGESWAPVGEPQVATAADGTQLVGLTYAPTTETGEVDPDAETYTAFAFYDPGFILLPSFVMVGLSLLGFLLHVALLWWDENREREDGASEELPEAERAPVPARA